MTHYHVKRNDYDSRTGHETVVELATASTYAEARTLAGNDEKNFRRPTADRFIWRNWVCPSCNQVHQ